MQRKRRGDVTRHTAHATRECVCVCRRRDRRTHDEVGGARSARRLARGSALARRASPVSALTEPSRRCNARGAVMSLDTRRTRHESACACVDGAIGARTTRSAALGRHDDSLAARRSLGGLAGVGSKSRRRCNARGAVMSLDTRRTRHESTWACVDGAIGARTTKSAALGRHDDSLAARRSLGGLAGVGSDRAEPAMRRERRRGDVTRHTAHTTRECVCVCRRRDRRTHDKVGGARSARRLARGSALARRASPVSALTEPSRRCNARGAVMSLDTRRTRHESACACVDGAIGARTTKVGGARSARRLARGSALARRASPVSALTEPSRRCNARGAVMSLDTRRTRHESACACVDGAIGARTTKVGGARSARRLARGSALARRASPVSALTEPSRRCNARGAVMSLDTRRTRHESACACVDGAIGARTTKVGGARSARRLARGSALARRASPVSALTEPSRRCNARGAVMSLDTRRTRHESACACVDGAIGARTTRSAALGRHDDSLAARRSLGGRRRCRL